jgi:hypothetical protein
MNEHSGPPSHAVFVDQHLAEFEAVFADPDLAICADGWWIVGTARSAEMRRKGRDDLFDHQGVLVTRVIEDTDELLACWVVRGPEAVAA